MRLLIADDHDLVLDGLKLVLDKIEPGVSILECSDFPEALEKAGQNEELDLAILDLKMPGMNGSSGVKTFRARFPRTPILVISGSYRTNDVVEALRCGAAGFVPKNLNSEAMLSAFRLVLAGEKFIPSDLFPSAIGSGKHDSDNPLQQLTKREREVLAKVPEGLTNKRIAKDLNIAEITVKLHVRSIYQKLGAKNRAQAVKIALDLGWEE